MNIIIKPIWLLIENEVQNIIGAESYGIYAALFSLSFLFISFSDLGINYFITQRLSTRKEEIHHLFSNAFSFKLILLVAYPCFMVLVGWGLGYKKEDIYLLAILSFIQAILQFIYFFRANFQASQLFALDSFASIADKVILIVIILLLIFTGLNLESFVNGRLLSVVIAFFILYAIIFKIYGWIKPRWDFKWIKEIMVYSWPFALINVFYSFNDKIDQVMVERILGPKEAGLYAGAYRWLDAFMMYLWTIMPIFFAKFSFSIKEQAEKEKIFNSAQIICAVPLIFVASFVFFYGDILFFQFTNSTSEQISVMTVTAKILFSSMLIHGFFSIYSTLLNSTGFVKQMSVIVLISVLLNVILNFIFIPIYGAIAAAGATAVSAAFISACAFYFVFRKRLVRIPFEIILKLTIILGISLILFYLLPLLNLQWYWVSILAGLSIILASLLLGFKKYLF